MLDSVIEIAVNFFQSFMIIGFFFFFFKDGVKYKKTAALQVSGFVAALFAALTYFSFLGQYLFFGDTFCGILIMEVYTVLFFYGNVFIRIIMPLFAMMVNTVISFFISYTVSFLSGQSYMSLSLESSFYRYFCIILINLINFFVFFMILKIKAKKLDLTKGTDIISFIVIPLLLLAVIYSTFYILHFSEYKSDILIYLIIICVSMLVITVFFWITMSKISRDNQIKTDLLLTEQREGLYKANILQTNKQIEKISKIKHDMQNNLLCIEELLRNHKTEEAKKLCRESYQEMSVVYTPVNSNNPLLNSVINVELEKAYSNQIEFTVNISDEMMNYSENPDIVSIIGNMCDNAIEYLVTCPKEMRKMMLSVNRNMNYNIITCKNKVNNSVLNDNPDLHTNKDDKNFHGKGIEIIKEKVEKYEGGINYYEEDGCLYAAAIIKAQRLQEF